MIRPLTIATFLLACGSGLYLYQSKHEVQLLDRTIERTVHDTNTLREQSRLLAAEWTMLNDPERLRQFSDTYLSLKTITPSQFSSLADLDNRLPAPRFEVPANGSSEEEPASTVSELGGASSVDPETEPMPAAETPAVAAAKLPVPPIPIVARAAAGAVVPRLADARPVDRAAASRPFVADSQARPADRSPEQHSAEQHVAPRLADGRGDARAQTVPPPRPIVLAAPRPQPVAAPVATAQARPPGQALPLQASSRLAPGPINQTGAGQVVNPQAATHPSVASAGGFAGSLLGMAHGSLPPAPRPTPVNASYNSN